MVSLRIYVEGSGEFRFVEEALTPHLGPMGVYARPARMGHYGRKPSGGTRVWEEKRGARMELERALRQSSASYQLYVTTMVDYYALPTDWPNRNTSSALPKPQRSSSVESGMLTSIRESLLDESIAERFIPYVSLHEFEALVLSKPEALLAVFPNAIKAVENLKREIEGDNPEGIDDCPDSAPSKRIERLLPEYAAMKGAAAANALKAISLEHLRAACPHFGQWLARLESLGKSEGEVG